MGLKIRRKPETAFACNLPVAVPNPFPAHERGSP